MLRSIPRELPASSQFLFPPASGAGRSQIGLLVPHHVDEVTKRHSLPENMVNFPLIRRIETVATEAWKGYASPASGFRDALESLPLQNCLLPGNFCCLLCLLISLIRLKGFRRLTDCGLILEKFPLTTGAQVRRTRSFIYQLLRQTVLLWIAFHLRTPLAPVSVFQSTARCLRHIQLRCLKAKFQVSGAAEYLEVRGCLQLNRN